VTVSQLVSRERGRLRFVLAAAGIAVALAAVAVLASIGALSLAGARWITRPSAPLAAWIVAAILALVALWYTRRRIRRDASPARVAAAIESERALRAGSLRGALEVAATGALGRRAADDLASRLAAGSDVLAPTMHRRALTRGVVALAAAGVGILLLAAASRAAPDGWRAMRHPVQAWTGELLAPLVVVDPPAEILRGERLRLRISAPERRQVTLHTRTTGAPWSAQPVAVKDGTAEIVLGPLDADLALVAGDGRVTSDTVSIHVTDRPFVGDVAIRATYPAYLNRAPETVPVGEPARLPRGSVLSISGRASTALTRIGLVKNGDTLRLTPDGHAFGGRLAATESGRWSWSADGVKGTITDVPAPLEIEVVADSAPRVEILSPGTDTVVLADARLSLHAAATDDHGLAGISLRSWRQLANGRAMPEVTQSLAEPPGQQWSGEATIDLAPRQLEPGDELHLVVAATDNSPWRQTATSRELVLRIPTMSEQRELARSLADSAAARALNAAREQRELAQRTGEAARTRADRGATGATGSDGRERAQQRQSMSFQSAEQAKALAEQQRMMQERVRALQQDAQELERQLRAAGALDSSLSRQLEEAQRMLAEALTPEMQAQLEELSRSLQQLSRDDVRRSLEQLVEQQQRLREQLERSAEMLKRAALEGAMQTLRDEATEIAEQERAVADSLARGDSAGQREARELGDRSDDLSREVAELAKRLERERAEAGPQKLEAAAERAEQSAQAMREAAAQSAQQQQHQRNNPAAGDSAGAAGERQGERQMQDTAQQGTEGGEQDAQRRAQQGAQRGARSGQPQRRQAGDRASAAREGAEQMEQAAQALSEARESQIQEWKNELTGELDRSIQEMLQMARQQEALAQRARGGENQQDLRGDQNALQQGVEKVGERIQRAAGSTSHISPQSQGAVGEARQRVQDAAERLSESRRAGNETATAMEEAAQALNRAASSLVRDRERAAGASTASGLQEMLERMREMAREQGSLNAQAAGLMPTPGGQMSEQAAAQARALAQRQRGLAENLEQAGDGEARAEALAREMREIAQALEGGRLNPELLERQQRLFRRLLDAGLSLEKEERDDKGERESQSATGTETITPGTEASGRGATRFREPTWNELRGLTAEERRAVLEYFKRINAERP
jgi:hypothetical protein